DTSTALGVRRALVNAMGGSSLSRIGLRYAGCIPKQPQFPCISHVERFPSWPRTASQESLWPHSSTRGRGGRWLMLTRAWDARPSLLVVDLETRGGARRVLEWRARQMVQRLGAFGRRGNRLAQVLLHLPEGVGPSPGWPAGARVIRTAERISPSRLLEIHERAFVRSFEVARGSIGSVFPTVCGVGLGELNLMTIQRHLASFSVIASALEDLLVGGQIGACRILSADVGLARALERQVARLVEAVSTWPPRRLLEGERWARSAWSALPPVPLP